MSTHYTFEVEELAARLDFQFGQTVVCEGADFNSCVGDAEVKLKKILKEIMYFSDSEGCEI